MIVKFSFLESVKISDSIGFQRVDTMLGVDWDGPLASIYKLKETSRSFDLEKTEWNVHDSDATIIFTISDVLDGGAKRTAEFAEKYDKPFLHVHLGTDLELIVSF